MPNTQPIGTVLARRRKELGVSVEKAAADTKLRPHAIEAFEYTDFDAMPPKGYARAAMGSYARYLGLDTASVLRAFDEQLAEHEQRQQDYLAQDERAGYGSRATWQDGASSRAGSTASGRPARGAQPAASTRRDARDDRRAASAQASPQYSQRRPSRPEPGAPTSGRARTAGAYGAAPQRGDRPERAPQRGSAARTAGASGPAARDPWQDDPARPARTSSAGSARLGAESRRPREMARPLEVDSGYEGGSGGRSGGRNQTSHASQQSVAEVFWGVVDAIRADRRTMLVFVCALAVVLVVVVAVAVSSCSSKAADPAGTGTIPVTSVSGQTTQQAQPATVVDTTKLNPSGVDLTAVPVNSKVTLAFAAEATGDVWAEVNVDGNAVYADKLQPGATLEWTMGRSLAVTLSDTAGVTLSINDSQVTPTISNGTYVLNASVPEDQWVQDPAPADSGTDDSSDGSSDEGDQDWSDYSYDDSYDDTSEGDGESY